jgi:uncharacterized NAD(P)/FAD-binding protein YdhS
MEKGLIMAYSQWAVALSNFKLILMVCVLADISELEGRVEELLKCKTIGILGSSQSAVDATVFLYDNGYKNKLTLVSNEGLLPKVKEFFPSNNINLKGSILSEIEKELLYQFPNLNSLSQRESFLADIRFAKMRKHPLSKMMEDLTPNLNAIWEGFTTQCREKFNTKYRKFFYRHRGGIVLENAEKIATILKSGLLEVKKLSQANLDDYDALICATGINPNYIKPYLSKELYQDDNNGGIKVDIKSCNLYNALGEIVPNIWAAGYMAAGSLKFVNSIYFLKYFGEKIANNINNINNNYQNYENPTYIRA